MTVKGYFLGCFLVACLGFVLVLAENSKADWRWAPPNLEKRKVVFYCNTTQCITRTYRRALRRHRLRVRRYNQRRLHEWNNWANLYIPDCTWYGESGFGPKFARYRYFMPNATGSGAYGKYQFMPNTYHSQAKYHDWSPLDQEIAGHREYWAHGTAPWANC